MNNILYNVKNRSASRAVYSIPEENIRRSFAPGETKRISGEELLKLSYQPGGKELMAGFLQIQSEEVLNTVGINAQPEYYMSEAQVIELLKTGSYNAFLDCLDFAPPGVLDLVRKYAVSLPLTDLNKRRALKDKLGFDVDKAIEMEAADKAPESAETVAPAPATPAAPAGRRTVGNYKPIEKTVVKA